MKKLLRPKVLIPAVLSLGFIVALLGFSDVHKVVGVMATFQRGYLAAFLVVIVLYELVRGIQWHFLLSALGIKGPIAPEAFSFLVGELAKSVPIGNYFQNYLLNRVEGDDIGRTSAASTLIILTEVAVSLLGVLIIGIDGWGWLRPVIVIGLVVAAAIGWTLYHFAQRADPPHWMTSRKTLRKLLGELDQFRKGAETLLTPSTLIREAALGAVYLVLGGIGLYVVMRGIGAGNIAPWQVLAVYFFSLGFSLIFPLPTDVGVTEVSGVGALMAFGVPESTAVAAMLVNRLLTLGGSLVIALLSLIFLRAELKAAFSERKPRPGGKQSPSDPKPERAAA